HNNCASGIGNETLPGLQNHVGGHAGLGQPQPAFAAVDSHAPHAARDAPEAITVQREFDGPAGPRLVRGFPPAQERGAPAPGKFQNAGSFTAPATGKRSHFHGANHEAIASNSTDAEQKPSNPNSFNLLNNCTG